MSDDLMSTLAKGLDTADRDRTLGLIEKKIQTERAAARRGARERNVDVGTRPRAAKRRMSASEGLSTH